MFFSDTEQITLSAVRRMIARVGKENIQDLLELRVADRMGMGRPKENPYRLRKYRSLVEEVLRESITPGKSVAIDGALIMKDSGEVVLFLLILNWNQLMVCMITNLYNLIFSAGNVKTYFLEFLCKNIFLIVFSSIEKFSTQLNLTARSIRNSLH